MDKVFRKNVCPWLRSSLLILVLFGTSELLSANGPVLGVQAGLGIPLQGDLRVTTGSGWAPSVGLHMDWLPCQSATVRTRVDLGSYPSADRTRSYATYQQSIHTRVKDEALGGEILCHPEPLGEAWSIGAGIYLIRWTVDSTNTLTTATGSFAPSGSSKWTREGLGILASHNWNHHLETELRMIASHYGYQNLPVRFTELNLLWHF